MQPANKTHRAASLYRGFIDARIQQMPNDIRHANPNAHAAFAQTKYWLEVAQMYPEDFNCFTGDDACKKETLKTACIRRGKPKRVFMKGDK